LQCPNYGQVSFKTGGRSVIVHAHSNVKIGEKKMTVEFIKDKETKTKVRYTAKGEVSGSIYVDKDSELAKDAEIILEIAKVST
jgi:DNA-directed RNA polymerase